MLLRQLQKRPHTSPSATSDQRQPRGYGSKWTARPACSSGFPFQGEQFFLQFGRACRKATPFDLQPVAALEIQVQLGPGGNSAVTNKSFEFLGGMGGAPVW